MRCLSNLGVRQISDLLSCPSALPFVAGSLPEPQPSVPPLLVHFVSSAIICTYSTIHILLCPSPMFVYFARVYSVLEQQKGGVLRAP